MTGEPTANKQHEVAGIHASDAFSLLGNETRLSILLELWETFDPFGADNTVPFSELHDGVDVTDSGQFNYHLRKLIGPFISRSDDGYHLTHAGLAFVQSVIAGTAIDDRAIESTEVDESCPRCGASVTVTYVDEEVTVACTECRGFFTRDTDPGGHIFQFVFPPAGVPQRTPEGILRAAFSYQLHHIEAMMDGVCPTCGGIVEMRLDVCEDHHADDDICAVCSTPFIALVRWSCRTCKTSSGGPSWEPVLNQPVVVAFFYNHGIEHDHSDWETARVGFECTESLISTDPIRLRITVSIEDDDLHLTVDEALNIIDVHEGDWASSHDPAS